MSAAEHAGCIPGQCRAGDQWRATGCGAEVDGATWGGGPATEGALTEAEREAVRRCPDCGHDWSGHTDVDRLAAWMTCMGTRGLGSVSGCKCRLTQVGVVERILAARSQHPEAVAVLRLHQYAGALEDNDPLRCLCGVMPPAEDDGEPRVALDEVAHEWMAAHQAKELADTARSQRPKAVRLAVAMALFAWDTEDNPDRPTWDGLSDDQRGVWLSGADAALAAQRPEAECDGSGRCPAPLHVHGCYADQDGSACDDPADHPTQRPEGVTVTEALAEVERRIRGYAERRNRTAEQNWLNPVAGARAQGRVSGLDQAADKVALYASEVSGDTEAASERCRTCMGSGWTGARHTSGEWSPHHHCPCGAPCVVARAEGCTGAAPTTAPTDAEAGR